MLRVSVILLIVMSFFSSPMSHGYSQSVAIDYVQGEGAVKGVRLGYRPWHTHSKKLPFVGEVGLYLELSANLWEFGSPAEYQTNIAIALSPVIRKAFAQFYGRPLYWEFGIGMSLVSEREFAGKDIGSYYQFEDRLGLAYALDERTYIALRYMHYSNGGLSSDNPGLDFINLSYSYRF